MPPPFKSPVFGLETEYANYGDANRAQMGARALYNSVDLGRLWLGNGSCLYTDCGHPEYCTPECTNPVDAVSHIRAGDLIVDRSMKRMNTDSVVYRSNTDEEGLNSWGCHESYLCYRSAEHYTPIIPHLMTRIIYAGSGGLNPKSSNISFVLSPRSFFFNEIMNADTQGDCRAILNTRGENLGSHQRLHLITGEPLCSNLSNYLKIGTTALIIWLYDCGMHLPPPLSGGLNMHDRTVCMNFRMVSEDITFRRKSVFFSDGDYLSALDVQQLYLEYVQGNIHLCPDWAKDLCKVWRDTLNRLSKGVDAVADRLDWAIKFRIFEKFVDREGPTARGLISSLGQELRNKLFEIDMRFGEVNDGIFDTLDAGGYLNHQIDGVDAENAIVNPPSDTRAVIRGNMIKSNEEITEIDWSFVSSSHRTMDLSDPFQTLEDWHDTWIEDETADDFKVGDYVILGKHELVCRTRDWHSDMDEFVGKEAYIIRKSQTAHGCGVCCVNIDGGRRWWRTMNMDLVRNPEPGENEAAFSIGDVVELEKHKSVRDRISWRSIMDKYVGKQAKIIEILSSPDRSGCVTAIVDIDLEHCSWRTVSMKLVERVA